MALQPDVDNPVYGYFVTSQQEEVITYCINILRRHNRSCIFILHSSAVFTRDEEEQELHMPVLRPILLDPQMPDVIISDLLENQLFLSTETELYENVAGSGWNLVPGTQRYWFKIHPCQPNQGGNPNRENTSEYDDNDDREDPDRPRSPVRKINHLLYAICEHYARKNEETIPRLLSMKRNMLRNYNNNTLHFFTDDDFDIEFHLSDLPEWHNDMKSFNIRVFSLRGNVLYAKRFNFESDEFIDLYLNSNGTFAYVRNLFTLFKKKHDRKFCMKCYTWKSQSHTCDQKKTSSKSEDVLIPDIPWGRHALVGYADFESIIKESGMHSISGWACMFVNKFHQAHDTKSLNYNQSQTLIKDFLLYLSETSSDYALSGEGRGTPTCQICEHNIANGEYEIVGRNFINGRSGSHHEECWAHMKNTMYVFFHNFRGYDSHFLIKEIVAQCKVLGLTATSMEKFNLITIESQSNPLVKITFKDTFNFFTCSLAKCVSMIENWVYTPESDRTSKGIFPYDWFDSYDKLNATSLPLGPWYNKLTNSIVDSRPAEKDWEDNGFTSFDQFHDKYMMIDVYQLCDAFEEFRRTCVDEFNTDPAHFQGAPSLTWYLGLCQNPQLFKIIKDVNVYMDIQNNIRGGVSQAMTKYCNVENKEEESMFFLDVNSLYSKCMTYKMPGKYLGKVTELPENWEEQFNANTDTTALLVVDLYYPEHLHDRDWAYPLAPHKYNDRLCTTFKRKENYMVHAELLSFYLKRGLILEKFHYMYLFKQDYTLRDYVQGNIEKRRHTKSEVMKTLYKLLNNSLYGKTCENVNKYRKFEVIEDQSSQVDANDPHTPFNEELADCINVLSCGDNLLVEKRVKEVRLNKPIQIGFTVLEFAKREIYQFLASIADHFGNKVIPLYTDTDSLLFWCDFTEPWKHFFDSPLLPYLDFEKTPAEWGVQTKDTDKQSGLWSIEAGGKEIVEYCGLRAKCYCYRFRDNTTVIKNKGVPKSAMIGDNDETPREKITMDHYKKALFEGETYKVCQYSIRSFKHDVITLQQYKLGLTSNDLKRAVTLNRAISLPFGYKGELFSNIVGDADDPDLLDT